MARNVNMKKTKSSKKIILKITMSMTSDTGRLRTTFGEVRPADGFVIKEKELKEKPTNDHPRAHPN